MRVWHNLYAEIITLENIFQAWEEFIKAKRDKLDVKEFHRHLEDNLFRLHWELRSKRYKHGGYQSFFVRDPKVRHIHKASVKDRVVHHLLSQVLEKIFEPTFYAHSYSCRKERGTHKGIEAFKKMARKASKNHTDSLYVLKCDIKKFFASVDHQVLKEILGVKIKDQDFMWLLDEIIRSFPSDECPNLHVGKGMPIGNLTSQLFANIYMNPFDQFVKHRLKIKYYIRYADDFVIFSADKQELYRLIPLLETFLKDKLQLSFHPKKIMIKNYYLGVDFLGYVIFPKFILPRTKTKKRMFRKVFDQIQALNGGELDLDSLNQAVQSYLGYLSYANSFKLSQELKNKTWFWLNT